MGTFSTPSDPVDGLRRMLADLQSEVRQLATRRTSVIPVLGADPPETDPMNVWLLADGRLRTRYLNALGTAYVYREYTPVALTGTAPPAPAPPPPTKRTYTKTYTAQWTASYQGDGDKRTDEGASEFLYYGSSGDAFNGRNRSLIGFSHATIAADLAGSTISRVRLNITNIHSWWNSGSRIHWGIHNSSSEPANWPGLVRSMIASNYFKKPENRWVVLPNEFATRIRDGSGKGVALESPSDSRDFYGYAAGIGSGYVVPKLEVTYVK